MATFNGIGEVAADTREFAPRQFVFRPGGTAEGNVYTDFAALYAVLTATPGRKELVFDDTFGAIAIPAGVYDFTDTSWKGSGDLVSVPLGIGTTISNLNYIEWVVLTNTTVAGNPPLVYNSGATEILVADNAVLATTGTIPLIRVQNSTRLALQANRTQLGTGTEWVALLDTSILDLFQTNLSPFWANSVVGAAGTILNVQHDVTSSAITFQPLMLGGTSFNRSSNADDLEVNPAGLVHVVSTDAQGAIADLDAAIGGGGGGDLAATLVLGNVTGPVGGPGLPIKGPTATPASGNDGEPLVLQGGDGDGAGVRGPMQALTTGNTRGGGAVDLQQIHTNPTEVAAPPLSVLIGGRDNTIALSGAPYGYRNQAAGIFAGWGNTIQGDGVHGSVILGGSGNTIDSGLSFSSYHVVVGGAWNTIGPYAYGSAVFGTSNTVRSPYGPYSASCAFVAGTGNLVESIYAGAYASGAMGRGCRVMHSENAFAMGRNCDIYEADHSFSGGSSTVVNASGIFAWTTGGDSHFRAIDASAFGSNPYLYVPGQTAWSMATGVQPGESQRTSYSLNRETTDATPTEMTPAGLAPNIFNRLFVRPGRTYMCRILVSSRQTGGTAGSVGDSATWEAQAAIKRDLANNTVLVGVPTGTGPPLFNDAGAAAWTIAISADNVNEALVVTVTGELNKTIRWTAHVLAAEVGSDT